MQMQLWRTHFILPRCRFVAKDLTPGSQRCLDDLWWLFSGSVVPQPQEKFRDCSLDLTYSTVFSTRTSGKPILYAPARGIYERLYALQQLSWILTMLLMSSYLHQNGIVRALIQLCPLSAAVIEQSHQCLRLHIAQLTILLFIWHHAEEVHSWWARLRARPVFLILLMMRIPRILTQNAVNKKPKQPGSRTEHKAKANVQLDLGESDSYGMRGTEDSGNVVQHDEDKYALPGGYGTQISHIHWRPLSTLAWRKCWICWRNFKVRIWSIYTRSILATVLERKATKTISQSAMFQNKKNTLFSNVRSSADTIVHDGTAYM